MRVSITPNKDKGIITLNFSLHFHKCVAHAVYATLVLYLYLAFNFEVQFSQDYIKRSHEAITPLAVPRRLIYIDVDQPCRT